MKETPPRNSISIARNGRIVLLLWAGFLIAGFGVSFWLEPDTRGFGTHEQLGWAACSFEASTGWPCPSCGMTTSFSHFIRGHWLSSLQANTTGFFMALFCAIQIPWSLISVRKRHLWLIQNPQRVFLSLLAVMYLIAGSEYIIRHWRK